MTSATITYNDGAVYLECDGNPLVIKISYEGKISAESALPSGFIIQEKNNVMLIIRMVDVQFPEHLFNYVGSFKIKRADLYNKEMRITANFKTNTHYFYKIRDNWEQMNSQWSEYYEGYEYGQSEKRRTDIVTNNLESKSGSLVLKDGTPYYGDVHFHSNGRFMTGAKHNKDSKLLYKKKKKRIIKNGIARKI
tara:strand:- start:2040 stop:2618 length:579 start_codon:yes stop_codon:yes gene_type:complete